MASNEVTGSDLHAGRRSLLTLFGAILTSGMELTSLRRICRAGKLTLKCYGLRLSVGIRNGNRREERLSIGVLSISADVLGGTGLNDVTQVHNGNTVGDVLNDGKVVGNEEIGHTLFPLKLLQKVDDLRLN
jgi:lysophospholipase L1-like esterase